MRFCDIPGHDDVKNRLREMVDDNRIPHAILLEGPEGTAKFAMARAMAQYIHCSNRHDGDSCGTCPSCIQHQAMQHIDTLYSFPVVKIKSKPTVSDDWRQEFIQFVEKHPWMDFDGWMEALESPNTLPSIYVEEGAELSRRLSFTAHSARYKVVLLWLPERMEAATANKLLKLIEEPFADTLFIMTSDSPGMVLPTVYSRLQRVPVKRYTDEVVARYLASSGFDSETAANAAVLAEGNLNQALKMARRGSEPDPRLELFMQLMRLAYRKDIAGLKAWSQKVGAEKREPLSKFLDFCLRMLRENFITNFHRPELNLVTTAEAAFAANFAKFVNERNVLKFAEAFTDARNDITNNANGKIVMFDLAVTVVLILRK